MGGVIFLKKLEKLLYNSASYILGAFVFGMAFLIFMQVFYRHALGASFGGTEELPKYFMIWCAFLGAGLIARDDDHISIDIVPMVIKSEKAIYCIRTLVCL